MEGPSQHYQKPQFGVPHLSCSYFQVRSRIFALGKENPIVAHQSVWSFLELMWYFLVLGAQPTNSPVPLQALCYPRMDVVPLWPAGSDGWWTFS